jgi:hypothetical protein
MKMSTDLGTIQDRFFRSAFGLLVGCESFDFTGIVHVHHQHEGRHQHQTGLQSSMIHDPS